MKIRLQRVFLVVVLFCSASSASFAWWWDDEGELERLVLRGLQSNPRVSRLWRELEGTKHAREALRGFWDLQLASHAGHSRDLSGEDRTWLNAGLESPLPHGGYLALTLEQGSARPPAETGFDQLHQTTARADWRLPLWRDRGHREWKLREQRARAESEAAYGRWLATAQQLRRDISLEYLEILKQRALFQVADSALERAFRLQEEAETLASLKTIPAYQVSAARLETALRREERIATRQRIDTGEWRLRELLGQFEDVPLDLSATPEKLLHWAMEAPPLENLRPVVDSMRRGDRRENIAIQQTAQTSYELALERERSDFALEISASHQGEDSRRWLATTSQRRARAAEAEAVLAWSRPWGNRAERAEAARHYALLAGHRERERELKTENRVPLETALRQYQAGNERLQMVSTAVAAANNALEAEEERFRLGESRSRNVLDAQKDLTDTMRRQILMAAELLQAAVRLHYSMGFALPHDEKEDAKEQKP